MMGPTKMGWVVAGGVLLFFLVCWNWGPPYIYIDQQGDIFSIDMHLEILHFLCKKKTIE